MTEKQDWLLFLAQLPTSPSSLRVLVWRRLRAAGATGLQNGVWVLPNASQHEKLLQDLLVEIAPHGGTGMLLVAAPLDVSLNETIIARFRADRDQEYTELYSRCQDFLAEIKKETTLSKFTFAELEENEQDLQKLLGWQGKIQARDVFSGHQTQNALDALAQCQRALQQFAQAVYTQAGLAPLEDEGILDMNDKSINE